MQSILEKLQSDRHTIWQHFCSMIRGMKLLQRLKGLRIAPKILALILNIYIDIKKRSEITKAIQKGEDMYKLKYHADVEDRTFGSPKLKKE